MSTHPRWLISLCAALFGALVTCWAAKGTAQDTPRVDAAKEKNPPATEKKPPLPQDDAAADEARKPDSEKAADQKPAPDQQKTEKPATEKPAADKPQPDNPVLKPLSEIFTRKKKKAGDGEAGKNAAGAKKPARSGIDGRAPTDKRSEDLLRRALAAIADNQWHDALDLLQRICALPEDSLIRTEQGLWISIHDEAQRLIGTAPADELAGYRQQYSGLAKQLLQETGRRGDPAELGRVARSYFHTDAGYEAANRIGSLHLDRGEAVLAARWLSALWRARPALTQSPVWRAKAALALSQAGQSELAREIFDLSTVTAAGSGGAVAGGSPAAARWLASIPAVPGVLEAPLAEWPMFFGTPRRRGVAVGGEPLLLPRWRMPISERQPVRAQIEHMLEDLADQGGAPPLPLNFPTLVQGKMALRTLHGVQVVDVESGRPLWQSEELQPLERLLGGGDAGGDGFNANLVFPGPMLNMRMRMGNMAFINNPAMGENQPLCHLLFRNANFGLTSSDGRRLFVVDDPQVLTNRQPGYPANWVDPNAPPGNIHTRLVALDLENGRPLWEVGGPANGESFDPPLAGYFFFGAPVADAGDLFVIGESTSGETNKEIRLLCLDAASGELKWSQLVANADPDIEKDLCRRWWTAQATVSDGMIICPTTVGWTVAVDRLTHNLLWGYRAATGARPNANPNPFSADSEMANVVQMSPLRDGWGPAPPVVADGRVVYSSPEAQSFICLDLATGKELWAKPRGTAAYFAGLHGSHAIVVGRTEVAALRLDNGAAVWPAVTIPAPAGRGVMLPDQFLLPVSSGEIWSIRLDKGEVTAKLSLPEGMPVGNLAMYRGMLLSVDALGVTAFEQRTAVQAEIQRHRDRDPRDPWALIRDAQIRSLARDLSGALATLRQVPRDAIPEDLQETFRSLLLKTLSAVVRQDLARAETDSDIAELEKLVATPGEQQSLRRLQVDRAVARGDFRSAFETCLEIARDGQTLLPGDDAGALEVRGDLWAAGQIQELLPRMTPENRRDIDTRIDDLQAAAAASEAAAQRFVTLFSEDPRAAAVCRQLAEGCLTRGEFLAAERWLQQMAGSSDRALAAEAVERLARLLVEYRLTEEAEAEYRRLEQQFSDVPLPDGKTGADHVRELRAAQKFPEALPQVIDWHVDAVRMERHGLAGFSNFIQQELTGLGGAAPFFAAHRLEVEPQSQRLDVIDVYSDEVHWSVPLRSRVANPDGSAAIARAAGHELVVLHQGIVHGLSPVDRRVLWTRGFDPRGPVPNVFNRNVNAMQPMQTPANLAARQAGLQSSAGLSGGLGLVSRDWVGLLGRRQLAVFDALTGEAAWTLTGVRAGTSVLGGDKYIYLRSADGQNCAALRARDGSRLPAKNLEAILGRFLHQVQDQFVLAGLAESKPGIRLYDPITDRDVWTMPLHQQAKLSVIDQDRAALLEPDGKFAIVNLKTGRRKELAMLLGDDFTPRSDAFVVADQAGLYLLLNKGSPGSNFSDQIPFLRANGQVLAFDLETGRQRWKQVVQQQNLLLERMPSSPFLLFSSREFKTKGRLPVWSLHLVAIDKLTGARLLDEKTVSQPGFRSLTVNAGERYVELRSYNERLRFYPADKPASAGQSGGD